METFKVVTGVAVPMLMNNINTDLIAPSHFPGKKPEAAVLMALKDKMFANLRYHPDGTTKPDFVLNQPATRTRCSSLLARISAAAARARPQCGHCARPAFAA